MDHCYLKNKNCIKTINIKNTCTIINYKHILYGRITYMVVTFGLRDMGYK